MLVRAKPVNQKYINVRTEKHKIKIRVSLKVTFLWSFHELNWDLFGLFAVVLQDSAIGSKVWFHFYDVPTSTIRTLNFKQTGKLRKLVPPPDSQEDMINLTCPKIDIQTGGY